jgi:hypothetical protein
MGQDMFHVLAILPEMDVGNEPQVIAGNIDDPPPLLEFEVVQRRKESTHRLGTFELRPLQHAVQILQSSAVMGMTAGSLAERFFRNYVHPRRPLTYWQR